MHWTQEDHFIYDFIKVHYAAGDISALQENFYECDVKRLTERISRQGVISFFYSAIQSGRVPLQLPPNILAEWKILAGRTALHNAFLEQEGGKILQDFAAAGIRCILLKGFSHAEKLYANRDQRRVGDIDILVAEADYPAVKKRLLNSGFRLSADPVERGSTPQEMDKILIAWETILHEMHFARSFGSHEFNIDVHWGFASLWMFPLARRYPLGLIPWFQYTERMSLGNISVECLRPELHFFHCIFHFALNNRFRGIKWLLDICQYVDRCANELDWQLIGRLLLTEELRKVVVVTMKLVGEVIGHERLRNLIPADALAGCDIPAWEYGFYRQRLFAGSSILQKFICSAFLPCKPDDRLRVALFMLFGKKPMMLWSPSGARLPRLFYPFFTLAKLVSDKFQEDL